MSQARASSAPAPRAMPAIAAMVGFVRCSRAQNASCPRVTHSWASFGASFAHSSMSIPEEKTRLPAPATTTARIESSFSSSGTRDIRSVTMERRIVFRGGFSSQRTATRPPFSMRRRGVEGIGPLADATEIIVAYGRRSTPFFYRATDTAPMRGTATLDKPWFARWPADLPRSLTYPDVPVQDLLRRTAGQHGDRPAVRFYGKTLTYRDLDAAVDRFAAGLRAIGVRAGDRVSLLLPKTPADSVQTPANPDDVAVLQYTGGTTGTPKGAMLTHRNLVANAVQCAAWFVTGAHGPERVLGAIPLFHVYGLTAVMLLSIVKGGEVILYPNPRDIGAILKLIHKTKPSLFPGVPTMYISIILHPNLAKYDLRSVRVCVSGAAPLPNEVRKQFEAATGGRIVEGYGLTEASPVTHCNPINGIVKECIGIPFPDTDAKLVDPEDGSREVPPGEIGELAVRGPQVMKGYWNHPEETAAVLRNGWLLTGDIAKMDEDGYFSIVDRKKDLILCSGYNVYPREVEEVLFMHPAVAEAAAIGVPDAYRGESVKSFVVLKGGMRATEDEIVAFCKERLAAFKVPKAVEFTTDLPKSLVGKVLRRELRERELAKPRVRA